MLLVTYLNQEKCIFLHCPKTSFSYDMEYTSISYTAKNSKIIYFYFFPVHSNNKSCASIWNKSTSIYSF